MQQVHLQDGLLGAHGLHGEALGADDVEFLLLGDLKIIGGSGRREGISAETLGLFDLTIEDASVPLLSYEELKNDISIRGAFFRELLPLLESENEEERRTAADALKYGLAALDGNDVIDF